MLQRLILLLVTISTVGCASSSYQYGEESTESQLSPAKPQQYYIGAPNKFLDSSDWIWPGSLLSKLILWNKNVDSHEISQETIDAMAEYIEENKLDDVLVLVNTYKPGSQWYRLFHNDQVGAGWRYTLGFLSVTSYTIFPGRFFGGDHFNPYTNTISLYSDDIAIALHEAAHAKDFARRKHKGLHAGLYLLPGAALYYEAVATSDALSYLESRCEFEQQKDAYQTLHPAYGTYVGGTFLRGSGIGALMAIPGHIVGNVAALAVNENPEGHNPPCPLPQESEAANQQQPADHNATQNGE
jgi:hypothetical protein